MSDQPAIRVKGLYKKFSRSLKRAMWYGLVDIARAALLPHCFRSPNLEARLSDAWAEEKASTSKVRGPKVGSRALSIRFPPWSRRSPANPEPSEEGLRPSEFWALRNISLELRRGQCLGVVGHNGAGKSTLFSVLSGIYGPTRGRVEIRGRLQALIALGAGFHPLLSGRENIYIYGAILGLREREIREKFDSILEFSELGEFIDMPVKNYSSGMFVRLGFSVAAHMDPDVLLVDEVLAVGDLAFQNKSFERMKSLLEQGVPMMFVSHSPQTVEMVATRVMWLEKGQIRREGDPKEILMEYATTMQREAMEKVCAIGPVRPDDLQPAVITGMESLDEDGRSKTFYGWNETIRLRFHVENRQPGLKGYVYAHLNGTVRGQGHLQKFSILCMLHDGVSVQLPAGHSSYDCVIVRPRLAAGLYEVYAGVRRAPTSGMGQDFFQRPFRVGTVEIKATPLEMGVPGVPFSLSTWLPPLVMEHEWQDEQGRSLHRERA